MSNSLATALWLLYAAQPTVQATHTMLAPVIDGRLDDPSWKPALRSGEFRQSFPFDGAVPTEKTQFRVLYDDEALYVGVDCEQVSAPILEHLTRRDQDSESEWIALQIDPRAEGKAALVFAVNVAGVLVDAIVSEPDNWNTDWDEIWEARAVRTPRGWSAEFRIPFRVLRFDATLSDGWGFQVTRYIAQKQETDYWSYASRGVANPLAHFGRLDGLKELRYPGIVELRPFITADERRLDATHNTTASGYAMQWSVGLDLKLHLSPELILDGAIRPDFGQVEADQVVLNLTNYETFLPDKRALFLEGSEVLAFPIQVFYSRRIGFVPHVPALRADVHQRLVNPPQPATIYGAAKLVGHLGATWTISTVSAVTGRNELTIQDEAGARAQLLVAPLTAYNVLRLKREWGSTGHVGIIATGSTTFEGNGGFPLVPDDGAGEAEMCPNGVTVVPGTHCFRDSYVGGIDGRWHSASGNYVVNAALLESWVRGGARNAQLDGTVIGPGSTGAGAWVRVAKEGGQHLLANVTYLGLSRRLDYNDVGYMPRQNVHDLTAAVVFRTLEAGRFTLDKRSAVQITERRSLSGLELGQSYELNGRLRFRNHWTMSAALNFAPPHFDDREIGDGSALERAAYWAGRADFNTDPGRRAVVTLSCQGQRVRDKIGAFSAQGTLSLTPLPQLEIAILPQLGWAAGEWRYTGQALAAINTGSRPAQVFGKLATVNLGGEVRVNYTFSPRVTLQSYAQVFLASGHFAELRARAADASHEFLISELDAAPPASLAGTPDFEQSALNLNLVFRWEYCLGSTIYVIYSRSQVPEIAEVAAPATLQPNALGSRNSADVILFKLSYWWTS